MEEILLWMITPPWDHGNTLMETSSWSLKYLWLPKWDWDSGAQITIFFIYLSAWRGQKEARKSGTISGILEETPVASLLSIFLTPQKSYLSLGPYFGLSVLNTQSGTQWWPNSKLITDGFCLLSIDAGQEEGDRSYR